MMVYGLVLMIHVLVAIFLVAVILLQGGRGGLGEALGGAAAQSLFGGGVNTVMTRITAICAGLFMITCLSLAALSTARGRSVIEQLPTSATQLPLPLPQSPDQMPQPIKPANPAQPAKPAASSEPASGKTATPTLPSTTGSQ